MDIQQRLDQLKALLERVGEARGAVSDLEQRLSRIGRDYERVVAPFNEEADRLEAFIRALRFRLERRTEPLPPPQSTADLSVTPPAPVLSGTDVVPPPPRVDASRTRKNDLADHIESFTGAYETVMPLINRILADGQRDLGDMLELLPWGDVWTRRTAWEDDASQTERLTRWHTALTERLQYWEERLEHLKSDSSFGLLCEQERDPGGWQIYLETIAARQETENRQKRSEIAVLEQEIAKRSEVTDD